ncbi:hypothetical protein [Kitasatospora phosalacinea]|uniref:hypothetical protein n=1 Tax=Kitasatospora phosalacinea TaxID=2065 RepID=UPI0012FF1F67|nr:hypothetical protein [Kitasatospora phosalacinea]
MRPHHARVRLRRPAARRVEGGEDRQDVSGAGDQGALGDGGAVGFIREGEGGGGVRSFGGGRVEPGEQVVAGRGGERPAVVEDVLDPGVDGRGPAGPEGQDAGVERGPAVVLAGDVEVGLGERSGRALGGGERVQDGLAGRDVGGQRRAGDVVLAGLHERDVPAGAEFGLGDGQRAHRGGVVLGRRGGGRGGPRGGAVRGGAGRGGRAAGGEGGEGGEGERVSHGGSPCGAAVAGGAP